jgi:hypothetical protein
MQKKHRKSKTTGKKIINRKSKTNFSKIKIIIKIKMTKETTIIIKITIKIKITKYPLKIITIKLNIVSAMSNNP